MLLALSTLVWGYGHGGIAVLFGTYKTLSS